MKLNEAIKTYNKPFLSMEIVPPRKGSDIETIFNSIETFLPFNPKFISVTNHQTQFEFKEINGNILKNPKNKQAGPVGLAGAIRHRYQIEPIPHLICGGTNRFQLENVLVDLQFLGIDNIFVVRGDANNGRKFEAEKDGFHYATEIVEQVAAMNQGKYTFPAENLSATNFCVGVAAYPEKHYEALNMQSDLINLKKKINAGADFIITQMFFDFNIYKNFVKTLHDAGIDVPVIPGIKPIIKKKILDMIPRAFFIDIPHKLVELFDRARTEAEEFKAGTIYMTELIEELIDFGVPAIHLFTMGKGKSAKALLKNITNSLQE